MGWVWEALTRTCEAGKPSSLSILVAQTGQEVVAHVGDPPMATASMVMMTTAVVPSCKIRVLAKSGSFTGMFLCHKR